MQIWDALTWQGKALALGAVLIALAFLATSEAGRGDSNGGGGSTDGGRLPSNAVSGGGALPTSTLFPRVTATVTGTRVAAPTNVTAAPTNVAAAAQGASPTSTPVATATVSTNLTAAAATVEPTTAPPTPRPVQPTAIPFVEPTAVPPTPVPAPRCGATATVSNGSPALDSTITVGGRITCDGAALGGAKMTLLVYFTGTTAGCSGTSDNGGNASCTLRVEGTTPGRAVSVETCFAGPEGTVCGQTSFTPR